MPKKYRLAGEINKSIGFGSVSSGIESLVIGSNASASTNAQVGVSVGVNSRIDIAGTAFGYNSNATGAGSTAIGSNTLASGDESVSIGYNAVANDLYSIAIGSFANVHSNSTVTVINSTGATFPTVAYPSNVYISSIHSLGLDNDTPSANVIDIGGTLYGMMYCNTQTGQITVIGQ